MREQTFMRTDKSIFLSDRDTSKANNEGRKEIQKREGGRHKSVLPHGLLERN